MQCNSQVSATYARSIPASPTSPPPLPSQSSFPSLPSPPLPFPPLPFPSLPSPSLPHTMPYILLLFLYRKADFSPTQFQQYCETTHIPFLRSLAGETFPRVHSRRYIDRQATTTPAKTENASGGQGDTDVEYPATALMGSPEFFDYDCIVEHVYDSEDAFKAFYARMVLDGEVAAALAADEAVFLERERTKAVVVADVVETKR